MQDFKHFDPKQAAMDEARGLLEAAARAAMADGSLPEKELPAFVVEVPNDVKNGDLASNFAMAGARVFGMPPRKIAAAMAAAMPALEETHFSRVEIAGPGFINLFLAPGWFADVVLAANAAGADYGRTSYGKGEKVNVEFVSANPTGPMHLGNAAAALWATASPPPWTGRAMTSHGSFSSTTRQPDPQVRQEPCRPLPSDLQGRGRRTFPRGLLSGCGYPCAGTEICRRTRERLYGKAF